MGTLDGKSRGLASTVIVLQQIHGGAALFPHLTDKEV